MTHAILYPMIALVIWTFLVLLLVPIRRFKVVAKGQAKRSDFRFGESENVPDWARLPNRNYMNLMEAPMLFYVACLTMYVTQLGGGALLALSWVYVGLRVAHSVVHILYNNVMHRLLAFASSIAVLVVIWILILLAL